MTTYALAGQIAWLEFSATGAEAIYAATLPDGPPLALEGSARAIFMAVVPGGTLEEILSRVADDAGLPPEEIHDDVAGFVDELVRLGLASAG